MKKYIIILIISLLIIPCVVFSQNNKIEKSGKLKSGKGYKVTIIEKPFIKTNQSLPNDGGMWGIDSDYPNNIIDKFTLEINDIEIRFPRKYYSDLCNISRVNVEEDKNYIIFIFKGGDAAGSFTAEFKIKEYKLVERIVRMGEMPENYWEKTIIKKDI